MEVNRRKLYNIETKEVSSALSTPAFIHLPSPRAGILSLFPSPSSGIHGLYMHLIQARTFSLCPLPGEHLAGRPGCPHPDRNTHDRMCRRQGPHLTFPKIFVPTATLLWHGNLQTGFSSLEFSSKVFENRTGYKQTKECEVISAHLAQYSQDGTCGSQEPKVQLLLDAVYGLGGPCELLNSCLPALGKNKPLSSQQPILQMTITEPLRGEACVCHIQFSYNSNGLEQTNKKKSFFFFLSPVTELVGNLDPESSGLNDIPLAQIIITSLIFCSGSPSGSCLLPCVESKVDVSLIMSPVNGL